MVNVESPFLACFYLKWHFAICLMILLTSISRWKMVCAIIRVVTVWYLISVTFLLKLPYGKYIHHISLCQVYYNLYYRWHVFSCTRLSAECLYVMISYFTCLHFYQRLCMMLLSQTVSNRNCSGWVENIHDEASNCEGFSIFRAFLIVKGVRKKVFVKHFFAWLIAENSFIPKLHTLQ